MKTKNLTTKPLKQQAIQLQSFTSESDKNIVPTLTATHLNHKESNFLNNSRSVCYGYYGNSIITAIHGECRPGKNRVIKSCNFLVGTIENMQHNLIAIRNTSRLIFHVGANNAESRPSRKILYKLFT